MAFRIILKQVPENVDFGIRYTKQPTRAQWILLIATAVFVEKRTWEPKVYEWELVRDIASFLPKKLHSGRVVALAKGAMGLLVEIRTVRSECPRSIVTPSRMRGIWKFLTTRSLIIQGNQGGTSARTRVPRSFVCRRVRPEDEQQIQ